MMNRLALIAFACLLPASAWGGSFINGTYESNAGYTIQPPKDWVRLDASTAKGMEHMLPKNISIEGINRFDVVFFPPLQKDTSLSADDERIKKNKQALEDNPEVDKAELIPPLDEQVNKEEIPEFSPTISILVLQTEISSTSPEMVAAYKKSVLDTIPTAGGSYSESFKIKEATVDRFDSTDGFRFKINFSHHSSRTSSREIEVLQTVQTFSHNTYIITCTSDVNDTKNHLDKDWCENTIKTMEFKK